MWYGLILDLPLTSPSAKSLAKIKQNPEKTKFFRDFYSIRVSLTAIKEKTAIICHKISVNRIDTIIIYNIFAINLLSETLFLLTLLARMVDLFCATYCGSLDTQELDR